MVAPLNAWARRTRWAVVLPATVVTAGWCALLKGPRLMEAWGQPDVYFYMRIALGRYGEVPQPFSARPLAPLLARGIAAAGHWPLETGFAVLAYGCLVWTLLVVFSLLVRSQAPRWTLVAVATVPFWPQLLLTAGLPDPLYAALLAALLVALERAWVVSAALLMAPLMLARESTTLTLLCLLLVGWRQLRWCGSVLAVASAAVGAAAVRHLSAGSLPNPEHLSGGLYMAGKVVSNGLRSLGVVPWSNVYPVLCDAPRWQVALYLGRVQSVGVCAWSPVAPMQALFALLATFGVLPVALLLARDKLRAALFAPSLLVQFCLLYGGLSLLLAPALGTWYARLFGYGWPLLLVAVPRLLGLAGAGSRRLWAGLLLLHLGVCALGNRPLHAPEMAAIAGLQAAAFALILVHRRGLGKLHESPGT